MNPRKLEHGFRIIGAGIPYTLPEGHGANDVPTFWLLLKEPSPFLADFLSLNRFGV